MTQPTIPQAFQLAIQHHQAGRLPQAETLYRQILQQQPNHAESLHYLGVIAHQVGQHDLAVDLIRRSIAIKPNDAEACCNLGACLRSKGQFDEAITAYRQAIASNPKYAMAHNNLGNVLRDKGQLDESITALRHAIALDPNLAAAHSNLGNALRDKRQLADAIAAFRQAIALNSHMPEAHTNLGNALLDTGQVDEAITTYCHAIALRPSLPEAHYNHGNALQEKGRLDEALAAYLQAIVLRSNYPEPHNNRGVCLKAKGQLDDAISAFHQALALKSNYPEAHSNLVYSLYFHPTSTPQSLYQEHAAWNQKHAEPLRKFLRPHTNDRSPGRRLKIGYVSPEFRNHCQSLFMVPLLSAHDHAQVEVFCYADVPRPDALTQKLQGYADMWRNIAGQSDEQVAALIRQDQIDVLVDLTMHMANGRPLLFARKPAPVQVCWLAYPGSTGLNTIDYRLSDPFLDPPDMDESVYSEKTMRLPDSFWCYDPLESRDIPVNALPALKNGVITFGCLNNLCKINEGILTLWSQVLRQVEGSRLCLLARPGNHRRLLSEFLLRQGVDSGRVEFFDFQPRHQYMELYHLIDIGLDSFPYNGHTTSLDSLWMGVPVVTMVGQTAVSRAGWCQVSNLGLSELAAQNHKQFVQIATELANDLPRLTNLRSTLRQRMQASPLMDAPRFARGMEAAFRQMWRKWCIEPTTLR